jgi:hypothetical protein
MHLFKKHKPGASPLPGIEPLKWFEPTLLLLKVPSAIYASLDLFL